MNNRLNECNVYVDCTEDVEVVWNRGKYDHGRIYLAEDTDGWRFGLEMWYDNGGFGFYPSRHDVAYKSRREAIQKGCELLLIRTNNACKKIIDDYIQVHFPRAVQLSLF